MRVPVRCPFCDVTLPRGELPAHDEKNVAGHLTAMKLQLDTANRKIEELKKEVPHLFPFPSNSFIIDAALFGGVQLTPRGTNHFIEHVVCGISASLVRLRAVAPPTAPLKVESESRDCLVSSGHTFSLYALIENDKIGLFLKYKSGTCASVGCVVRRSHFECVFLCTGPLPVTLDFTVAVRQALESVEGGCCVSAAVC